MIGSHRCGIIAAALFCMTSPVLGQSSPGAATRAEVQQAVRAYTKAVNDFDLSAYTEMYSRQPGVTAVSNGQIVRGWDQIRDEAEQHLGSGLAGKFSFTIGAVEVTPIGADHALALTKFNLTVNSPGGQVQRPGTMTLLFKKIEGEWKIIHDHTSLQDQDTPETQVVGASADAVRGTTATARDIAIADGRAVEIQAAGYVHYSFQLPSGSCTVTGRLVGISGGRKDFESFILDDENFQNWSAGQQANAVWQSGRVVIKSIENAVVAGPGTYHLVISNVWSGVTPKTVQPQAMAHCS